MLLSWAVAIALFIKTGGWAFLLLIPVAWLGCSYWELAIQPLRPIGEQAVETAKKAGNMFTVILITIGVLFWLASNL